MATYGDITHKQMTFLVELVERSHQAAAQQRLGEHQRVEWLLILNHEQGTLVRAGASWPDLPADRTFYQSLARRGYLGLLASEDISSGEVVIWPTERAESLAAWATSSGEGDADDQA